MTDTLPPYKVSIMSKPETKLRRRQSKFGEGYAQRIIDGLNHVETTWTVKFPSLTAAEKNFLVNFFDTKGGAEPFYWTAQGEVSPKLWTCPSYDGPTAISGNLFELEAKFEICYDIVA